MPRKIETLEFEGKTYVLKKLKAPAGHKEACTLCDLYDVCSYVEDTRCAGLCMAWKLKEKPKMTKAKPLARESISFKVITGCLENGRSILLSLMDRGVIPVFSLSQYTEDEELSILYVGRGNLIAHGCVNELNIDHGYYSSKLPEMSLPQVLKLIESLPLVLKEIPCPFKPFDQVLVRNTPGVMWTPLIFSRVRSSGDYIDFIGITRGIKDAVLLPYDPSAPWPAEDKSDDIPKNAVVFSQGKFSKAR